MGYLKAKRQLLIAIALLGIVIGPASIANAKAVMLAAEHGLSVVSAKDMSEVMPCCPSDMPIKTGADSKSCPIALVCTTVIVSKAASEPIWKFSPNTDARRFRVKSDEQLKSSLVRPPTRPPKI